MLSQVKAVKPTNTVETINQMLTEITDDLKEVETCKENKKKDISKIIELPKEVEESSPISSKNSVENLGGINYR
jgi:hypothetical protein